MFENFDYKKDVDLKNYSTMKTGGRAKYIVFPRDCDEVLQVLEICRKNSFTFFILGNGSNVLFSDDGFDGVLISLKNLNKISQVNETEVWVEAGANLFTLNMTLMRLGLSGLEFCYGIPASIGGFVYMNGGCFGYEIGEFVEEIIVLDGMKERLLKKEELEFSYRHSNLQDYIILNIKLKLKQGESKEIMQKMEENLKRKRETQPCDLPSLGSVFKVIQGANPIYPAKLIDSMGLKGVTINGAEVSKKHAGFIVNTGNATSRDVLMLVEFLENKFEEVGLKFQREIIVLDNKDRIVF